jgi:RNA polymerase sigma-54 factor
MGSVPMALSPRLELRQGQQLVLTPQLQQAIKLLQLSNLELGQFVEEELERNPLLERDERGDEPDPIGERQADGLDGAVTSLEEARDEAWLDLSAPRMDAEAVLDTAADNVYPDASPAELDPSLGAAGWTGLQQRTGNGAAGAEDHNLEAFATSETSLREHLAQQLSVAVTDPLERIIGGYLIDMVDEAGYLRVDAADLADKLGCGLEVIARVIGTLQAFDPAGVCARDLAECLALQLKDRNRYDPQIGALLDNLQLVAEHNLTKLRKAVGCDMDELAEMIAEIRQLSPKPGLKFGAVEMQPVIPDVSVRAASDGSWIVELNADTLPRVLVNRSYLTRVSRTSRNSKDKDYIVDCLQTANWLVKSLDQRARTILRVSEEIVRQQDGFLTHGVRHLRPLNLKTVADAIKMHESTVSRVTSNKYIATPRGIFELKFFFTSSIASAGDGEAHSSESVRHRIKELIDAELPTAVLSDDTIVERLSGDGIDIARRTVAKYREAMRIPSSVQRRREKSMMSRVARTA